MVREARCGSSLGLAFEGMTIPEVYLTLSTGFKFHEAIPDLANIAYISDPREWFVLLRTAGLWRLLLPTDPAETEEGMLRPERIEERMQGVLPTGVPYDVRHRTAYRVHERVAEKYVVGRVMLAGDAAHVNNPLGGMGMNGGVHDAFNLSAKLIEVLRGADAGAARAVRKAAAQGGRRGRAAAGAAQPRQHEQPRAGASARRPLPRCGRQWRTRRSTAPFCCAGR